LSSAKPQARRLPYEEDVLVPLLIRGPNIPQNARNSKDVYSMPDLGATILRLAGANVEQYHVDGTILLEVDGFSVSDKKHEAKSRPRHTLVEYWNGGLEEGKYAGK
ncbi:hypothetical protein MPER_12616, partial [Moniliophthora perniciosa FA553]